MKFHSILVFLLVGFYTETIDTPPSTRKRGFKLEFPGDDTARDSLHSKFQQIKQCSSERLTNSDAIINKVLDFWISSNIEHNDQECTGTDNLQQPPSYQKCEKEDTNTNISSVHILQLTL